MKFIFLKIKFQIFGLLIYQKINFFTYVCQEFYLLFKNTYFKEHLSLSDFAEG